MSFHTLQDAVTRGRGVERSFRCPVHEDKHASASVNVIKGKWVCYTCGAHGTTTDIVEPDDAFFSRDVEELLGLETRVMAEEWLESFTSGPTHPYWLGRFSQAACDHFQLGYDHFLKKPCYPMRSPSGQIWGLVHRNLGDGPKYHYPFGPKKSQTLFNYSASQRSTVYLCEGAMDVVACWEAGVEAFGIYGAQLSRTQMTLVGRCEPTRVALLLDNDKAGLAATEQIGNRLCEVGYEVVVPDWQHDAKDIAELSVQLRRTLLDPLALTSTT